MSHRQRRCRRHCHCHCPCSLYLCLLYLFFYCQSLPLLRLLLEASTSAPSSSATAFLPLLSLPLPLLPLPTFVYVSIATSLSLYPCLYLSFCLPLSLPLPSSISPLHPLLPLQSHCSLLASFAYLISHSLLTSNWFLIFFYFCFSPCCSSCRSHCIQRTGRYLALGARLQHQWLQSGLQICFRSRHRLGLRLRLPCGGWWCRRHYHESTARVRLQTRLGLETGLALINWSFTLSLLSAGWSPCLTFRCMCLSRRLWLRQGTRTYWHLYAMVALLLWLYKCPLRAARNIPYSMSKRGHEEEKEEW